MRRELGIHHAVFLNIEEPVDWIWELIDWLA